MRYRIWCDMDARGFVCSVVLHVLLTRAPDEGQPGRNLEIH